MNYKRIITTLTLILSLAAAESLYSVFNNADPAFGYDKYLVLEPDITYTGGLGVYENRVFIEGNGAVIDLQEGGGIWVYADDAAQGSLDIDRCSIVNGGFYGLNYSGISTGSVTNCNLFDCEMGIQLADTSNVVLKNTNFVNNQIYGVAIYSEYPTANITWCNAWNNGEDYMENCPG